MSSASLGLFAVLSASLMALLVWKRLVNRTELSKIVRGPPSHSWLFGNMTELGPSSEYESYGGAYTVRGCLGETRLVVSDPLALKYLYQNGDLFKMPPFDNVSSNIIGGYQNIFVAGQDHQQIRNMITPAFAPAALKDYIPYFQRVSEKVMQQWTDQVTQEFSGKAQIDIHRTMHQATLDSAKTAILGESGDYGPIEVAFADHCFNILSKLVGVPTKSSLLIERLSLAVLPESLLSILLYMPDERMNTIRKYRPFSLKFIDAIVERYTDLEKRDTVKSPDSVLDRMINNEEQRLSINRIATQVPALLIAGQDTVGNTISWALYEFAAHPEWQENTREEIIQARSKNRASHLDGLSYLNAHIKEILRLYPGAPMMFRVAKSYIALPLAIPVLSSDGRSKSTQIPIQKGQRIMFDLAAYNRKRSVWGEDAAVFKPSRWLDAMELGKYSGMGPYANLASFSGGSRSCIGWRFAILQVQTFLAEFLTKFRFRLAEGVTIRPVLTFTIYPATDNQEASLPLEIEPLA
ncbi:cytochrome P450 [Rhodocollybia butyracea]|uniref:Cytochrome P450 n=1 Tax=Rhodocollybia butyracea TaxID=206335 RepID=A0A9P5Q4F6_9AGAR|nr:cytochrome P450 [Rhodocollybia butyracea]